MTIWLIISVLFIGACGYLVHGGDEWIFSWYFKNKTPVPDKIPAARYVGAAISTIGFASWLLYHHEPIIVSLELILTFAVGWFVTLMFRWNPEYDIKNWAHALEFFARMLVSIALFVPLSILTHQGWWVGVGYSVMFAFGATLIYWAWNHLPKPSYYGDAALNLGELGNGMWIIGLTMFITS